MLLQKITTSALRNHSTLKLLSALTPFESPNDPKQLMKDSQQNANIKEIKKCSESNCKFYPNTQIWYGPNGQPVLPDHPQKMIFKIIHEMTRWNTDKMVDWEKQLFWNPSHKTAAETYHSCLICPKLNPGKPIQSSIGHFHCSQDPVKFSTGISSGYSTHKYTNM